MSGDYEVIAIGSSWGGLKALSRVLDTLPGAVMSARCTGHSAQSVVANGSCALCTVHCALES